MRIQSTRLTTAAILSLALVGSIAPTSAFAVSLISGTGNPGTAVPGGAQITFESVAAGPYGSLTTQGVTFAPDVGYASTPGTGTAEYVNAGYAGQYNTTGQSLQNTYSGDAFAALRITFPSQVVAFAFNWGAADTNWLIDSYNGTTLLGTVTVLPTTGGNDGTFVGVQDISAEITSAVIYVDTANLETDLPDYVFIDNFTFSQSAIPETPLPAALPLFASGLGALGLLGWCRKRKNSVARTTA